MNFEPLDSDAPVPIVPLRYRLVTRGKASAAERAQAEAIAPTAQKPRGYLHPTEGWVSGGWPA